MKSTLLKAGLLSTVLLFTGCGVSQPNFYAHMDEDKPTFRLGSVTALSSARTSQEEAACSIHMHLHAAARVTLEQGYYYFAIVDNRKDIGYENNMNGLALNTPDAYMKYCNPKLKEKDTGLEDDKCQYHHMGYDISNNWGGQVLMMKKRTYLFPTWDARKVMEEEGAKANTCIDWSKYPKASSIRDAQIKY